VTRRRLLVATRSTHKLRELRELLDLRHTDLVSLDDLGIPDDPVEDGATFETNATIKARFGARRSGLPTVADDSGIEVDALGGGPGVRTRRYAGEAATDADNNTKLLGVLRGLPPERRGARYVCVLALVVAEAGVGDEVEVAAARGRLALITARGTCRGRIAIQARGTGGFGYDPIFEPASEPPGGRTLGMWSPVEKHAISHRARAARRLAPRLAALGF
jgi:XTP/dITP diphosphohydrolase